MRRALAGVSGERRAANAGLVPAIANAAATIEAFPGPAARRLPALRPRLPFHELHDHRVAVPDHLAENFLTRGQELAGMRRQTSATHVVLDLSCPPLHAGSCIGDLKIDPIKLGRAGPLTLPCG